MSLNPTKARVCDLVKNEDLYQLTPDGTLVARDRSHVRFRLFVEDLTGHVQEANRLITWEWFEEWLDAYGVLPDSLEAASIAGGVPVKVDVGIARFVRCDR